ncbi:hypothetical protein D3C77_766580 [compost metagenome]
MIEVARTDTDPVVDQHHLQVQETRLVLVDAHPGAQQTGVIAVPGVTYRGVIGARPGQQQPHIDPLAGSPA